jgi:hypothetical protein
VEEEVVGRAVRLEVTPKVDEYGLDVGKNEQEVEDAAVVVWTTLYREKDKNN